jgi:hypothetical protein
MEEVSKLTTQHDDLILEVSEFPTVTPKFSMAKWESGEGGNADAGENPSDN